MQTIGNLIELHKNDAKTSRITNSRQYHLSVFVNRIQEEQKKQNWHNFCKSLKYLGKKPPSKPKYININHWESFKKAKSLPKDMKYYRVWTPKQIAIKLAHVQTWELPIFYSMIADHPNFLKAFFGKLSTSKDL